MPTSQVPSQAQESEELPPLPLYVVIPPSRLFAAHWSFFLPDCPFPDHGDPSHAQGDIGRRIHVSGDRLNGFQLEIIRGYDVSKHRSVTSSRQFMIGAIPRKYLEERSRTSDGPGCDAKEMKEEEEGAGYVDNLPRDDFEEACVNVPAPGPSLNKVRDTPQHSACSAPRGAAKTSEAQDCQWWIKQVVKAMTDTAMLISAAVTTDADADGEIQNPLDTLARLPKH